METRQVTGMRIAHWPPITLFLLAMATLGLSRCGTGGSNPPIPPPSASTFSNPLLIQIPTGGTVQECPDPVTHSGPHQAPQAPPLTYLTSSILGYTPDCF
jgi:hypothetical protein